MNHVTLIGRITNNLVLRETSTGKSYVFFTVAVDDRGERTDFVQCVAWNRVAENMSKFVGKGSLIAVAGKLTTRKDNRDQFIMEVSANSVSFLDNRKREISNKMVSNIPNDTDSGSQKNIEKTSAVNIDEALKNTESYDTEISFVNNSNLDNSDSDDEAIIWD